MRQTHARLSAQMECLQKRVDANKSNLSTQNSSTTSSQASLKEDLKQSKQELDTFMKEAHFFKGKCSLLEEQLKEQEEQLECNQELVGSLKTQAAVKIFHSFTVPRCVLMCMVIEFPTASRERPSPITHSLVDPYYYMQKYIYSLVYWCR